MTSPPSPPTRRRRRIVVVAAVLAVGLGWWYWPRVDQRFVGTWEYRPIPVNGDLAQWSREVVFILNADGTGESVSVSGRAGKFQWWIREAKDRTLLVMLFPSTRSSMAVRYSYLTALYTAADWPIECEVWDTEIPVGDSLSIYRPGERIDLVRWTRREPLVSPLLHK